MWDLQLVSLDFTLILKELLQYFNELPDSWIQFDGFTVATSLFVKKCKKSKNTVGSELKSLLSQVAIKSVGSRIAHKKCLTIINQVLEIMFINLTIAEIFSEDMSDFWAFLLIEHEDVDIREMIKNCIMKLCELKSRYI